MHAKLDQFLERATTQGEEVLIYYKNDMAFAFHTSDESYCLESKVQNCFTGNFYSSTKHYYSHHYCQDSQGNAAIRQHQCRQTTLQRQQCSPRRYILSDWKQCARDTGDSRTGMPRDNFISAFNLLVSDQGQGVSLHVQMVCAPWLHCGDLRCRREKANFRAEFAQSMSGRGHTMRVC